MNDLVHVKYVNNGMFCRGETYDVISCYTPSCWQGRYFGLYVYYVIRLR